MGCFINSGKGALSISLSVPKVLFGSVFHFLVVDLEMSTQKGKRILHSLSLGCKFSQLKQMHTKKKKSHHPSSVDGGI